MRWTTWRGLGRVLVGLACFGLYCAAASAGLSHVVANASAFDAAAATAIDAQLDSGLAAYAARQLVYDPSVAPRLML